MTIPNILTKSGVTVMIDGRTYQFANDAVNYNSIMAALKANDLKALRQAVNVRQTIVDKSGGKVNISNGQLYYSGELLRSALATRIMEIFRSGFDVKPLTRFLENLMANPSKRAVDELYGFLEACNLPITEDGHFLAYKRIRNDYRDIHSGTMDNSVGNVLEMTRNAVCDDKDNTCSYGLHFCSQSYLPHFGSGPGNRVVVVKINPADVVSIPSDYANAKGRTCRYEVVDELPLDEAGELINHLPANYTTDYSNHDESDDYDDYDSDEVEDDDSDEVDGYTVTVSSKGNPSVAVAATVLDAADVRNIRKRLKSGASLASIAREFGVSARTIGRIRDGESWTHVK